MLGVVEFIIVWGVANTQPGILNLFSNWPPISVDKIVYGKNFTENGWSRCCDLSRIVWI